MAKSRHSNMPYALIQLKTWPFCVVFGTMSSWQHSELDLGQAASSSGFDDDLDSYAFDAPRRVQ